MTTLEPGASDVLTHGLTSRPRCTALRASRPAPIITSGFEVLVQLVIAAMTTSPWSRWNVSPSTVTGTELLVFGSATAAGGRAGSVDGGRAWPLPGSSKLIGSDAGKVPATASSSKSR